MKFNRMTWQWILGVVLLVWIVLTDSRFSSVQWIFNIIGVLLLFCGILGRLYATLYIGGMKNVGSDGNSFVSSGVYGICRNPLYFFSFIALLGLLFIKGQIILIFVVGALFLLIYHWTILGEEKFLRNKFGESYEEFLRTTPRFFPNLSKFSYPEKLSIYPLFLHKEIKQSFVWIIAAFCIYMISHLQSEGILRVFLSVW